MNCEQFNDRLDDWLDGEMPAADARILEAHAANCVACQAAVTSARRLRQAVAALPASREPSRDLWPDIESRLEARARRNWPRALAAGVAMIAVFAAGMLASRLLLQEQAVTPRLADHTVQETRNDLPSLADARNILPASHVELIEAAAPADGRGTEQALLRNLLIVNLAIRDTQAAITDDPANADLRELLLGLYAEENRILAQAERLRAARQVPVRTSI
ncbi:MAG TPA: zf-HC2 domain-containing protein [Gammaproteobacteria bacterium]